jgi:hypothetical protein
MSINALANSAAARRTDFFPLDSVPIGLHEIALAASRVPSASAPAVPPPASSNTAFETAMNVLFGYVPTEIITLYVAVLAAIGTNGAAKGGQVATFWAFFVATPIVIWLVYGIKVIATGKPVSLAFKTWPVWEMVAGTIAFFAWALALPNAPYVEWYSQALAGVGVLIASTVLGLLAPYFQRPLKP